MHLAHRRRSRPSRARADDRSLGAVLVEAAFVTPIFFMLVLGIAEVGLAMNDNLAVAHTVRAGSRVASASGNDIYADYGIIQAVKREISAVPRAQILKVVVYRANSYGQDPPEGCKNASVTGQCNVYDVADFDREKGDWGCQTGENLDIAWCPTTRKVTQSGTGPEYVGVWIEVRHDWVTKMFGNHLILDDQSVIRLEPRLTA